MSVTTTTRILSPEEIAVQAGQQLAFLHLPEPTELFAVREQRLRELAPGSPLREFLLFAAELSHAQHALLQDYPPTRLPDEDDLAAAARAAQAPMPAALWPRDPVWVGATRRMLEQLAASLAGNPAQAVVTGLLARPDGYFEAQADSLLTGQGELDMACAPLVAAGLQVYWTQMVLAIERQSSNARQAPFGRTLDATRCPCCASVPTASVTRLDASGGNLRYLQCSLCATQWHMVRVKCSHCLSTKGIHYQSLQALATDGAEQDPSRAAVQAETCDECGHYLKIVRAERDLRVEPVADDLATLTLDILVSEAGYQPHGLNLLLLTDGGADTEADIGKPSPPPRSH